MTSGRRLGALLLTVVMAGCLTPATGREPYRLRFGLPGPDGQWQETWVDERVVVGRCFDFGAERCQYQVSGRLTRAGSGALHFTGSARRHSHCRYDTDVVLGGMVPPDVCGVSGIVDFPFLVFEEVPTDALAR